MFFALFLSAISCLASSSIPLDSLDLSIPPLQIKNSSGLVKSLDGFPRPILVHFWASWCSSCKAEIPDLANLARKNPSITLILISVDTDAKQAEDFLQKVAPKLSFWQGVDDHATKKYWAWGLPTTYVFGEKTFRSLGPRKWSDLSSAQVTALFSKTNKSGKN